MRLILRITEEERHLLELSLQRWRWSICEDGKQPTKNVWIDAGQQQACRFTTARIDEMLARLRDLDLNASEPITEGTQ